MQEKTGASYPLIAGLCNKYTLRMGQFNRHSNIPSLSFFLNKFVRQNTENARGEI